MGSSAAVSGDINPRGAFIAGLGFVGLAAGLIILSLWFVQDIHQTYSDAMRTGQPVFLEHSGYTVFYMAPLVFAGLFIIGAACAIVGFRARALSKNTADQLNKVVSVLVVIGLLGMFAGSFLANRIWAEQFERNGYAECPGSFSMTSKWFTSVWVTDSEYCRDEGVRRLFREGKRIPAINAYIEQVK